MRKGHDRTKQCRHEGCDKLAADRHTAMCIGMVEASDAVTKAVTNQQHWDLEAQQCAQGTVEAGDAATKAVTRQQHREALQCAQGMVEACDALMKAVIRHQ